MRKQQTRNDDSSNEYRPSISRRGVLKYSAAGIGLAGLPVESALAASDFVDILSVDPSNYPEILLNVFVDTAAGRDGELTTDDFRIVENGLEQAVERFNFTSSTVDLVFVFDDTGSMGNEIAAMKREVKSLTDQIEDRGIDAKYGLVSFKDSVDTDLALTDDAELLREAVDTLYASGGGDAPEDNFDAIETALGFEFRPTAQKVFVDITDNVSHYRNDGSGISGYTIGEVANDLTANGITYVAVAPNRDDPASSKKVLAEMTGGLWMDIASADFDAILDRIIGIVLTAYVLGYTTSTPPGETRMVGVGASDPERGTDFATGEVDVPEDAEPIGPGAEFERLREEKLGLANRIESISRGSIREVNEVRTTLDALELAATDGTLSNEEAVSAVQRLMLGETVTERTIVGAGPATPENPADRDYDLAGATTSSVVDAAFSALFSLLPLDSVVKRIPFGEKVISTAKKYGKLAIKRVIRAALNSVDSLKRYVRREVSDIADDIFDQVMNEAISDAEEVVQAQAKQSVDAYNTASELLINLIENDTHEVFAATDLNEAVSGLNRATNPTTEPNQRGTLDGADRAAQEGIDEMESIFEETSLAISLFDEIIDIAGIAGYVVTIATFAGIFTGGIISVLAQLGGALLDLATASLKLLKANAGWSAMVALRDNHERTLENIVSGNIA